MWKIETLNNKYKKFILNKKDSLLQIKLLFF